MTAIEVKSPTTDESTVAALLELGNVSNTSGDENSSQASVKSNTSLSLVDVDSESKKSEEPALIDESATPPPKKKSVSQKTRWDNMCTALLKYKEEYGNTLVPFNYDITDTKLGRWVNKQRSQYNNLRRGRQSQMTMERVERLEEIGFEWSVNPLPAMEQWEAKWELLRDFTIRYGHTKVPDDFVLEGVKLGQWVTYQRSQRSRKLRGLPCEITDERVEKLDSLGFEWLQMDGIPNSQMGQDMGGFNHMNSMGNPRMGGHQFSSWDTSFDLLCRYKKVHGDTRVPISYCPAGVALGEWVFAQRQELGRMRKGMPHALKGFQIDKLNEIEFEWNVFEGMEEQPFTKRMKMSHPISPGNDHLMGMQQSGFANPMSAGNNYQRSPSMDHVYGSVDRRSLLERARMMEGMSNDGEPLQDWNTPAAVSPVSTRDMALDRMVMREKQMRAAALYQNEAMMDHQPQQPQQMFRSGFYR